MWDKRAVRGQVRGVAVQALARWDAAGPRHLQEMRSRDIHHRLQLCSRRKDGAVAEQSRSLVVLLCDCNALTILGGLKTHPILLLSARASLEALRVLNGDREEGLWTAVLLLQVRLVVVPVGGIFLTAVWRLLRSKVILLLLLVEISVDRLLLAASERQTIGISCVAVHRACGLLLGGWSVESRLLCLMVERTGQMVLDVGGGGGDVSERFGAFSTLPS